jgi:hypothetical protein
MWRPPAVKPLAEEAYMKQIAKEEDKGTEPRTLITLALVLKLPYSSIEALDAAIGSVPHATPVYRRVSGGYLKIVEA